MIIFHDTHCWILNQSSTCQLLDLIRKWAIVGGKTGGSNLSYKKIGCVSLNKEVNIVYGPKPGEV